MNAPRVALVHDWLTGMRGGEYVLEAIAELFPAAEIFTLIHVQKKLSPFLESFPIHTSCLQSVPGIADTYRYFLPVMPTAIGQMDLSGFDLVISSSHCVAKGIPKPPQAVHVSYIHAPMRYVWDRYDDYFGPERAKIHVRLAARSVRSYLQRWDRKTSQAPQVDSLIANSTYIQKGIQEFYGRSSAVIHPFVEFQRFQNPRTPEPFYLMVGAFAPNKRVDIAIEAFNRLKLPLWIVGGGQQEEELKKIAGSTIRFLGRLRNEEISNLYSRARAFIFPGKEDFGITPLEAMAAGLPVVALKFGGVLDSVIEGETGIFFDSQTPESLAKAVEKIENQSVTFDSEKCRKRAEGFSKANFQSLFKMEVKKAWESAGKPASALEFLG